jgi:hypothetical protein
MDMHLPSMREQAQRLLVAEANSHGLADLPSDAAVRVCEKLRISLTRFAGKDGFTSLLKRALSLARAEVPSLNAVEVKSDGSLGGFETLIPTSSSEVPEAAIAIIAHLLGLLVTFVGKSLTLRLLRETWSDGLFDERAL